MRDYLLSPGQPGSCLYLVGKARLPDGWTDMQSGATQSWLLQGGGSLELSDMKRHDGGWGVASRPVRQNIHDGGLKQLTVNSNGAMSTKLKQTFW